MKYLTLVFLLYSFSYCQYLRNINLIKLVSLSYNEITVTDIPCNCSYTGNEVCLDGQTCELTLTNDSIDVWTDAENGNEFTGTTTTRPTRDDSASANLFDGIDDFLTLGDNLDIGTNDLQVEAWIYSENTTEVGGGAEMTIVGKGYNVNSQGWGVFYYNQAAQKKLYFFFNPGKVSSQDINSGVIALCDSTWHYVVATADRDGDIKLFYDGVEKSSAGISANADSVMSSDYNFNIGKLSRNSPDALEWNGYIGRVRMSYTITLTDAAAVLARYNEEKGDFGL